MTDLWIATANPKKRVELERVLAADRYRILTIRDLDEPIDIVEDGDSFAANAAIKATTLAKITGKPTIGDDSGICVDALDGAPGIFSARYAGPGKTDRDRIDKLLAELAERPDAPRTAHFTCHICLAGPDGVIATFEEHCHGTIATEPRGEEGFGYDPVFLPDEFAAETPHPSFAQLRPDQKDEISHRGRALRRLVEYLSTQTP